MSSATFLSHGVTVSREKPSTHHRSVVRHNNRARGLSTAAERPDKNFQNARKPARRAHSPHSRARDAKHQGVGDDPVAAILAPPQVRLGGLDGLQERDLRSETSARGHAWVGGRVRDPRGSGGVCVDQDPHGRGRPRTFGSTVSPGNWRLASTLRELMSDAFLASGTLTTWIIRVSARFTLGGST